MTTLAAGLSRAFIVGIDGGGSGTRAAYCRVEEPLRELARANSGPSGLGLGVQRAWAAIESACAIAFQHNGLAFRWEDCHIGLGLAGTNHVQWRRDFLKLAPARASLCVEGDALTTLLGAHAGEPGVIVALGTGSVGAVLDADGSTRQAGGFGFPAGDEASGAWLGLRALAHAQQALDGRVARDAFAEALLEKIGVDRRETMIQWATGADQTAYATLAPVVFRHAGHPVASALIGAAALEVLKTVRALDPTGKLPVALCGSLGPALAGQMGAALGARLVSARGDAVSGALMLARRLAKEPA